MDYPVSENGNPLRAPISQEGEPAVDSEFLGTESETDISSHISNNRFSSMSDSFRLKLILAQSTIYKPRSFHRSH